MTGTVSARLEAVVSVLLRSPDGHERPVECIVETGFDGELGPPAEEIERVGAPFSHPVSARFADGSVQEVDVSEVDLRWDGERMTVYAEALADPLLGTRRLARHRLTAEFASGGAVTIRPLA